MVGDVRQLPPVQDLAMYSCTGGKLAQLEGRELLNKFNISIVLKESYRQKNDPEFSEQLDHLASGQFTMNDWNKWKVRELAKLSTEEKEEFINKSVKLKIQHTSSQKYWTPCH